MLNSPINEAVDNPGLIAAALLFLGLFFSWILNEALWSNPRKRAVCNMYDTNNRVLGRVLREMTIGSHGTTVMQSVRYIYQRRNNDVPSQNSGIDGGHSFVVKKQEHKHTVGDDSITLFGESSDIELVLVPDYPNSGFPLDWWQREVQRYDSQRSICMKWCVVCLLIPLQILCSFGYWRFRRMVNHQWHDWGALSNATSVVFISISLAAIGRVFSFVLFTMWKRARLENNLKKKNYDNDDRANQTASPNDPDNDGDLESPLIPNEQQPDFEMATANDSTPPTEDSTGDIQYALPPAPPHLVGANAPLMNDEFADVIMEEAQNEPPSLDHFMHGIDRYRGGEWDLRMAYVRMVVEYWNGGVSDAEELNRSHNMLDFLDDTAVGNLVKGEYLIHLAWEARDDDYGDTVTMEAVNEFRNRIEQAKEALMKSAEQDPQDPCPWAILSSSVARCSGVSLETSRSWYDNAMQRAATSANDGDWNVLYALQGRLQLLCAKSQGSHDQMYSFSRGIVQRAPRGHPAKLVHLQALEENWLFLKDSESCSRNLVDWKRWYTGKSAHSRFLTNPQTIEETKSIYLECCENTTISNFAEAQVRATILAWLFMVGELDACRNELIRLYPWRQYVAVDGSWIEFWYCWDELRAAQLGEA